MLIYILILLSVVVSSAGCAQPTPTAEPEQPAVEATEAPEQPVVEATEAPAQPEATEAPPPVEEQKLTIWINGRDSFIGPNEQQLPQDQCISPRRSSASKKPPRCDHRAGLYRLTLMQLIKCSPLQAWQAMRRYR